MEYSIDEQLFNAAKHGLIESVIALLAKGADPNARFNDFLEKLPTGYGNKKLYGICNSVTICVNRMCAFYEIPDEYLSTLNVLLDAGGNPADKILRAKTAGIRIDFWMHLSDHQKLIVKLVKCGANFFCDPIEFLPNTGRFIQYWLYSTVAAIISAGACVTCTTIKFYHEHDENGSFPDTTMCKIFTESTYNEDKYTIEGLNYCSREKMVTIEDTAVYDMLLCSQSKFDWK